MKITLSYAQTLDGRMATRDGSSQWISGPESLLFAHQLRAEHDAIMVGIGTVLRDNPRLTVRLVPGRNPLRVIVDSRLRTPPTAAVLRDGAASSTMLACLSSAPGERREAIAGMGATILELPADARGGVSLPALVAALRERGVTALMVEGGSRLITALLRERLATRLAVTVAPKLLGEGLAAIGDLGISQLDDAYRLHDIQVQPYGADLVIVGTIAYPEEHSQ